MMNTAIPPKLKWACRRGMLELDILLSQFLHEVWQTLSLLDQEAFKQLLTLEDQDLYYYLTGKKTPKKISIKKIVEKIRVHAKNRH